MTSYPKSTVTRFIRIAICSVLVLIIFPVLSFAGLVPDTGQTSCYDNRQQIACPAPGADFHGQDATYTISPPSFTKLDAAGLDLPDSATSWAMIRDEVTGLIWEVKTTNHDIHDTSALYTWQDAQDDFIDQLNTDVFGGISDWRLPTVKELAGLVDSELQGPAIDLFYFPNTYPGQYWTITPGSVNTHYAWVVDFDEGVYDDDQAKTTTKRVLAVSGATTPDSFTDNHDGTVTDNGTGLVWQKATYGPLNWKEALAYCETLTLDAQDDWRLPTVKELQSLVDYSQNDPAVDSSVFPGTESDFYWHSTTRTADADEVMVTSFDDGRIAPDLKVHDYYVRAVRGGPVALPITGLSPTSGPTTGWTKVTITGLGFGNSPGTGTVTFGGVAASSYTTWTDTKIVCPTPVHAAGAVDVVVTENGGNSGTLVSGFTYLYKIAAEAGEGGLISPSGTIMVQAGQDKTFYVYPNHGYQIDDVLVDSGSVGAVSSYTFDDVSADHTIEVSFAPDDVTHTITASAGSGGRISPSGETTVVEGNDQPYTITPVSGYHIVEVVVDGVSKGVISSYLFKNVTVDHTISAVFALDDTHTITASAGTDGTISPSGTVVVTAHANKYFTITPGHGYAIRMVLVDGVSVGAVSSYLFRDITADHTISASFVATPYTITSSAGTGGSISPSGPVAMAAGGSKSFAITPYTGYGIDDVLVDGRSVGPVSTYTFTNVHDDHTITASFSVLTYIISPWAGAGGTISPFGHIVVTHGGSQTFTITPDDGYHVANVFVGGLDWIGAVDSYTFTKVTDDKMIVAVFTSAAKGPSTITCELSTDTVTVGEPFTISGLIDPAPDGAFVDVTLVAPNSDEIHLTTVANYQGEFSLGSGCGNLTQAGTWTVRASWNGDYQMNGASSADQSLTVEPAQSRVTLSTSSQAFKLTDGVHISGKFTPQPDCGEDLSGIPLTLTLTGPDASGAPTSLDIPAVTDDVWGHFLHTVDPGVLELGEWTVQASFAGDDGRGPAVSEEISLRVVETAGYAIIVQGASYSGEGLDSHSKTARFVYGQLKERGLTDDDIFYFNYDDGQEGVDAVPSRAAIQEALVDWAPAMMNAIPANLYIVMVDHGLEELFMIHPENITSADLAEWLDDLQGQLFGAAVNQEILVMLGFCHAGSFIDDISVADSHRVVIASAAPDEVSYKGPLDEDGVREGEFFISEFFKKAVFGHSVAQCFNEATELTEIFTSRGDGVDGGAPYFDQALQHPLLAEGGDATGWNLVPDDAFSWELTIGVAGLTGNDPGDVMVTSSNETVFLDQDQNTANLWAGVSDNTRLRTIWCEVKPPGYSPMTLGDSGQAEMILDRTPSTDYDPNADRYLWHGRPGFDDPGTYQVFYFAKDDLTGNVSPLVESRVYKALAGNLPPGAFGLTSPPDGQQVLTTVVLKWEDSVDPDGDDLTYTVLLSKDDPGFTNPILVENLKYSTVLVGPAQGLEDLSQYYWKVLAIDEYGAVTESSETWWFFTNNTNPLVGWLTGKIYDQSTGQAVNLATVYVGNNSVTTAANGLYLLATAPGGYNYTVTASGYEQADGSVSVADGAVMEMNVALTPGCSQPLPPESIDYPGSVGETGFTVAWTAIIDADEHVLERAMDDGFTSPTEVYRGASASFNQDTLDPGTYYYRVKAENSCGESGWKAGGALVVTCLAAGAPDFLNIPESDDDGVFPISWGTAAEADGYTLERSLDPGFDGAVEVYSGADTSCDETGLPLGSYYYRVRGENSCAPGDWVISGPVLVGTAQMRRLPVSLLMLLIMDDEE